MAVDARAVLQRLAPRRAHAAPRLHPLLKAACVSAVALGVALRLLAFGDAEVWWDGQVYAAMGHALAQGHGFLLPWGEEGTWGTTPAFSHHYGPLWPATLAAAYAGLGFSAATTQAVAIAASLAAIAVVYVAVADVLHPAAGALAAAFVALDPSLVWATGTGFSENLVLVLFAATLGAILRSLDNGRFMVLAGLFAGLTYLTRASAGALFVVAGLAGLAWRWRFRGSAVLRDVPYLAGIALFLALAGAWALRNVAHFGWTGWQTSTYTSTIQACIARDLLASCTYHGAGAAARFGLALAAKAPLFAFFALLWALPFAPELRASLRRWREERTSALWLATGLVFLTGWVLASLYWAAEDSSLWWPDNRRYVVLAVVPLLLAAGREARWDARGFAQRATFALAVFAVLSGAALALPMRFSEHAAAEALAEELQPGAVVAVDGNLMQYAAYTELASTGARACLFDAFLWAGACTPDFVLARAPVRAACYADNGFVHRADLDRRVDYAVPGWPASQVEVWQRSALVPRSTAHCSLSGP